MSQHVHLITDHGAVADGRTVNTRAIQKALDAAAKQGGGTVVVPPGVFVTGTLWLRDRVTLEVQGGATLLGSPDIADYPVMEWGRKGDRHPHHMIVAHGVTHAAIRGNGTLDGNGPAFWESTPENTPPRTWIAARSPRVSPMIELRDCKDLRLSDLTIANSPGWTVHVHGCDRTWVRGIRLLNPLFGPNTDGFDIDGCHDLMMSDCHIECGDDAIVLKTTRDSRSCERITVTNCVIRTHCVALKCGTESWFDFKQITFSNCIVYKSTRAVGLYMLDGASIEDVAVSNIVCDTDSGFILNRPIHIDLRKRPYREGTYDSRPLDQQPIGKIRNISISNFIARTDGRILMTAADGGRLRDITLRDVQMIYPVLDDPRTTGAQARSAQFSNASPEARVAPAAVVADQVDRLVIAGLTVVWPEQAGPPSPDTLWARGLKGENGSNQMFQDQATPSDRSAVPMHAVWARGVRGGRIDVEGVTASAPGIEVVALPGSDVKVRS